MEAGEDADYGVGCIHYTIFGRHMEIMLTFAAPVEESRRAVEMYLPLVVGWARDSEQVSQVYQPSKIYFDASRALSF